MRPLPPLRFAHGPFSFPSIPWPSPIRFSRRRSAPPFGSTDPQHTTTNHVLPTRAGQSFCDRLERVHNLTLPKPDLALTTSTTTTWDPDVVLRERWGFSLRRLPSTIPGAGRGLFLTSGKVEKGEVITLFPGLIYAIPYDLECCMVLDDATLTLRPPEFLIKNEYLLRFHDTTSNKHILIDGCPRGHSALNYIKAMQKRTKRMGNIEWLEAASTRSCLLRHNIFQPAPLALVPLSDNHLILCRKLMAGALGMGHLINDCYDTKTNQHLVPTAEFHLYQLPKEIPHGYRRFIPNVNFSERLEGIPYTVLVCAAQDLEATPKAPVELLAKYTHTKHKLGFPLL